MHDVTQSGTPALISDSRSRTCPIAGCYNYYYVCLIHFFSDIACYFLLTLSLCLVSSCFPLRMRLPARAHAAKLNPLLRRRRRRRRRGFKQRLILVHAEKT
jgi:hypothetical protein